MPATDYELALMNSIASECAKEIRRDLKSEQERMLNQRFKILREKGWDKLFTSEEESWDKLFTSEEESIDPDRKHGYFAVVFQRCGIGETETVIAHRGTRVDQKGNILADIELAQGKRPQILNVAFQFTQKVLPFAPSTSDHVETREFTQGGLVTHTGFSLGGFIAGAAVILCDHNNLSTRAVTFDSPGLGALDFDTEQRSLRAMESRRRRRVVHGS